MARLRFLFGLEGEFGADARVMIRDRAFQKLLVRLNLLEANRKGIQEALLLITVTLGLKIRARVCEVVCSRVAIRQVVHFFLEKGHARLGHIGVHRHGATGPGDQVLDLLLLAVDFRPQGLNAGVIFIETILEQVVDIPLDVENSVRRAGDIGFLASQGGKGVDEFIIRKILDLFHQDPAGVIVNLGTQQIPLALIKVRLFPGTAPTGRGSDVDPGFACGIPQSCPSTAFFLIDHLLLLLDLILQRVRTAAIALVFLHIAQGLVPVGHGIGDIGGLRRHFTRYGDLNDVGSAL